MIDKRIPTVDALVSQIREGANSGVIVVLGDVDTGKSTVAKQLSRELKAEIVDADVGQSTVGPPATVTLGELGEEFREGYFVGDVTPRSNLLPVLAGAKLMVERACRPCIVDTDGLITGGLGRAYKEELLNLLSPDVTVLLNSRISYYRRLMRSGSTYKLNIDQASDKSRGQRVANRTRRFQYFLSTGKEIDRPWSKLPVEGSTLGLGRKIEVNKLSEIDPGSVIIGWKTATLATLIVTNTTNYSTGLKRQFDTDHVEVYNKKSLIYRLVGCYNTSHFLGIGTITSLDNSGLSLIVPSTDLDTISLGSIRVKPSGEQVN